VGRRVNENQWPTASGHDIYDIYDIQFLPAMKITGLNVNISMFTTSGHDILVAKKLQVKVWTFWTFESQYFNV
jgi:hypothetical protein